MFCHVNAGVDDFDASATPVNNVWHSPYVGPMWSKVGTLHLKKGDNIMKISEVKSDARIDRIYLGIWPPFAEEPRQRIAAHDFDKAYDKEESHITVAQGLGFSDGVLVLPFDTPSYDVEDAPYVEYDVTLSDEDRTIEVRTLPTLHVYESREARYAIQIGNTAPRIFSIHTSDFSSEWRYNVLHGYSSRSVNIPSGCSGNQKIRIWLLDPGIVLQEILIR